MILVDGICDFQSRATMYFSKKTGRRNDERALSVGLPGRYIYVNYLTHVRSPRSQSVSHSTVVLTTVYIGITAIYGLSPLKTSSFSLSI